MKSLLLLLSLVLVAASALAQPVAYEQLTNLSHHLWNNTTVSAATTLPMFAAGLVALGIARHRIK